uniref:Uncharacterized protein n=1 Tax=Ditylenchus dipsaci TaxID=166011 RepID=A0A915E0R4_9BILA
MGGYHSSKDNEEQNLAYEEMLQLLNKSIEATEKIEELQESRIFAQKRGKENNLQRLGEKQVSDLQLREDWRRKMEEELSKIEQTKVELEKQKQRQQEVVNQKIEEELNRIAIENALKSMEEEDDGNASKETAWKSAGTAKKEAKKKRGSQQFPGSSPSTPFLLLQEKSLLTKRKEEPVDIKPATLQSKSRTAKQWAIPTRVLQTSSEPTPSEAIAKKTLLDPSLLLDINVVGDPDRVNAGEIDRMPPKSSKKKKKR